MYSIQYMHSCKQNPKMFPTETIYIDQKVFVSIICNFIGSSAYKTCTTNNEDKERVPPPPRSPTRLPLNHGVCILLFFKRAASEDLILSPSQSHLSFWKTVNLFCIWLQCVIFSNLNKNSSCH